MDKDSLPVLEKKVYIKPFLKLIERELEKGLPNRANEWDMTLAAYKIFHKGIRHLLKDEEMAYGEQNES